MATPVSFIKEVRSELEKVTWPAATQVWRSTMVVIFISVAIGIYIGVLDYVFVSISNILLGTVR